MSSKKKDLNKISERCLEMLLHLSNISKYDESHISESDQNPSHIDVFLMSKKISKKISERCCGDVVHCWGMLRFLIIVFRNFFAVGMIRSSAIVPAVFALGTFI